MIFNKLRMPEAEVSLRLAMYLLDSGKAADDVYVAIDGAQIKTSNKVHFPIHEFLSFYKFRKISGDDRWHGTYEYGGSGNKITIHSSPGLGDVTTVLFTGKKLIVESKKGDLEKSKSSSEYKLIREALGQLITIESDIEDSVLAVSVPYSKKTEELAIRWSKAPFISKNNIGFLLVDRSGVVREYSKYPL